MYINPTIGPLPVTIPTSSGINITPFITIPVNEIKATDISTSKYKTAIEVLVEK